MKTCRSDVIRDKRKTYCVNSRCLGFSTCYLRFGDLFQYKDESGNMHVAICHGRIKPAYDTAARWQILAQVVDGGLSFTMERWIDPSCVIAITPKARINPHIAVFFIEHEAGK